MKFSLVLATVGRVDELKRFLEYLEAQRNATFELIVVDQNVDDRLMPFLASYAERFPLIRLRSERGLSRARNVGLKHITGDVVAFPDDDCWYPTDLLGRVRELFSEHPEWDGITGRPAGPSGVPWRWWDVGFGELTRRSILHRGISFGIFLRREVVRAVGTFDETLGAGAGTPWNWGEESDYLLRALQFGFRLYDHERLVVYHNDPTDMYDQQARIKIHSHAVGMGHFLRQHRYTGWAVCRYFVRPLCAALYYLATGRVAHALQRWAAFRGRLAGYIARDRRQEPVCPARPNRKMKIFGDDK